MREARSGRPGPAVWLLSPVRAWLCGGGARGAEASRPAAPLRPARRRRRSSGRRACTAPGADWSVRAQPPASIFWAALRPDSQVRKRHGPRGKREGDGAEPRKCAGARASPGHRGGEAGAGGQRSRRAASDAEPSVRSRAVSVRRCPRPAPPGSAAGGQRGVTRTWGSGLSHLPSPEAQTRAAS